MLDLLYKFLLKPFRLYIKGHSQGQGATQIENIGKKSEKKERLGRGKSVREREREMVLSIFPCGQVELAMRQCISIQRNIKYTLTKIFKMIMFHYAKYCITFKFCFV